MDSYSSMLSRVVMLCLHFVEKERNLYGKPGMCAMNLASLTVGAEDIEMMEKFVDFRIMIGLALHRSLFLRHVYEALFPS